MSRAANLGPGWSRRADGTAHRQAARVLVFDTAGRVLLVRGHDADQVDRTWWFTIGGGIEPGETPRQAAVRELQEETGITAAEDDLIGPVLRRCAEFDFFAETVCQDEVFFLAHLDQAEEVTTAGWTEVERRFMDEVKWWQPAELAHLEVEIFPQRLPELASRWSHGWDGVVLDLGWMNDGEGRAQA